MPPKRAARAALGRKAIAGRKDEQSLSSTSRKSASLVQSSSSSTAAICAVCEQRIEDGKDQALFCEGVCQQWLHRYCAGVPVSWFATLSKSAAPFQCYSCSHKSQAEVVEKLFSSISSLQAEVSELKKVADVLQPLCMKLTSHSACCDVSDGGAPTLLEGPRPLSCHQTPHQSIVSLSTDAGRGHIIMREGMHRRRRAGADEANTVVNKRGRDGKDMTAGSAGPQRGRGGGSSSGGLGSVSGGVGGGGEGEGDGDGGLRGAEGVREGPKVLHTGVKVQDVRRVWGTMRMFTSGTVQSAASRTCDINTIRVKRKTKEMLHGKQHW